MLILKKTLTKVRITQLVDDVNQEKIGGPIKILRDKDIIHIFLAWKKQSHVALFDKILDYVSVTWN